MSTEPKPPIIQKLIEIKPKDLQSSAQLSKKTKRTHMLTGCLAGMVSRTMTSPLERLRIMQQTGRKPYTCLGIR